MLTYTSISICVLCEQYPLNAMAKKSVPLIAAVVALFVSIAALLVTAIFTDRPIIKLITSALALLIGYVVAMRYLPASSETLEGNDAGIGGNVGRETDWRSGAVLIIGYFVIALSVSVNPAPISQEAVLATPPTAETVSAPGVASRAETASSPDIGAVAIATSVDAGMMATVPVIQTPSATPTPVLVPVQVGLIRTPLDAHRSPAVMADRVNRLPVNSIVLIAATDLSGQWYQLTDGTWILAAGVEIVVDSTGASAQTSASTTLPTSTPTPSGLVEPVTMVGTSMESAQVYRRPGLEPIPGVVVPAGSQLLITGIAQPSGWYQMADGTWIAPEFISFGPPTPRPVARLQATPTPEPPFPTATPAPTWTSTPTSIPPTSIPPTSAPPLPVWTATPVPPLPTWTSPAPLVQQPPAHQGSSELTVATWNVELNDADPAVIADRMAVFQGVDLWGLTEINRPDAVPLLEFGAEEGEGADFKTILGQSGGGDRLLAIYDAERFDYYSHWEINEINTTGNARAPLVLQLTDRQTGTDLLFMVNHLYRSRDEERHRQATLLNQWAARQTLPVIAVGDYNFDWDVTNGDWQHDVGYDLMTANNLWHWTRPAGLVTTQCSDWPCAYNSVLDFVFVAGPAQSWPQESQIIVTPGDFPDTERTSDHRPVLATFRLGAVGSTGSSVALAPPLVALTNTPVPPLPVLPTSTPVPPLPTLTTIPPTGQPGIVIAQVNYNGDVPEVESDEYAEIGNRGQSRVDLMGWRLNAGDAGQDFYFGPVILEPGAFIRVYTNEVHPEFGGLSFGSPTAIWRNDEPECGYLYNADGIEISRYCYDGR